MRGEGVRWRDREVERRWEGVRRRRGGIEK